MEVGEVVSTGWLVLDFALESGAVAADSELCSDCKKVTKTFTKPDELYLGRQRGSQDADADEFTIDGE